MAPSSSRADRPRISDLALLLVAVVLLALSVRVVLALDAPSSRIGGDPAVYDEIGVSIAGGEGWSRPLRHPAPGLADDRPTALHPPAWPALLGATYALTDHDDHLDEASVLRSPPDLAVAHAALSTADKRWTAARLVNALLGAAAVGLIALIALELWGPKVGLVAGVVAAIYPSLAVLGVALLSEPLFVALELGAIYAVLRRRRPGGSWRWLVVAGVLCGLAVLTRANGAVLLVPLCLAVWTGRPRLRPRALLAPAAIVVAAALTVLPWTLAQRERAACTGAGRHRPRADARRDLQPRVRRAALPLAQHAPPAGRRRVRARPSRGAALRRADPRRAALPLGAPAGRGRGQRVEHAAAGSTSTASPVRTWPGSCARGDWRA